MKFKFHSALAVAALVGAMAPAGAQVTVSDQEYRPGAPAAKPAGAAATPGEPTAFELPIDSADMAVNKAAPFRLRRGVPIHTQLEAWARFAGWQLIWYPSVSWRVIGDADLNKTKDVSAAVEEVVNILRDEGKPIRLRISEGNRIMEVVSNEVRSDE